MLSRSISSTLILILIYCLPGYAQVLRTEQDIRVSMRMIGHEVLLQAGDSTSRVLPIEFEDKRYKISFDSDFDFRPENLVNTIDGVVKETDLARSYLVEVEECETGEIVYSFKVEEVERSDIIPCKSRLQPRSCYFLWITLTDEFTQSTTSSDSAIIQTTSSDNPFSGEIYLIIALVLAVIGLLTYLLLKRKRQIGNNPNMIPLGEYHFDTRNTELLIRQKRIELTGKEADLLLLLYKGANTTIERDVILNMVWGDEGGYVGRTLDVFISKLRKKLEFDSRVKIVNIRGVGYKLVLDEH